MPVMVVATVALLLLPTLVCCGKLNCKCDYAARLFFLLFVNSYNSVNIVFYDRINKVDKTTKAIRRQYDPVIIERTIGLVLGPSTVFDEPFLKHSTLTNKAEGTMWRVLSEPPQRRQGPDLCPLWLLVGTPSAIIPELAFSRAEHNRPYADVAKYIFDIYFWLTMQFVYWFFSQSQ